MNGVKYCENFTGMVHNETISLSGIGFVNKYDLQECYIPVLFVDQMKKYVLTLTMTVQLLLFISGLNANYIAHYI